MSDKTRWNSGWVNSIHMPKHVFMSKREDAEEYLRNRCEEVVAYFMRLYDEAHASAEAELKREKVPPAA